MAGSDGTPALRINRFRDEGSLGLGLNPSLIEWHQKLSPTRVPDLDYPSIVCNHRYLRSRRKKTADFEALESLDTLWDMVYNLKYILGTISLRNGGVFQYVEVSYRCEVCFSTFDVQSTHQYVENSVHFM